MPTLTQAIRNTKRRQFEKTHKEVKDFLLPDLNLMTKQLVGEKLRELVVKNQELENELTEARKSFETHIKTIDGILGRLDEKKLNIERFQVFGGEVKQAISKIQLIPGPKGDKPMAGVDYPIPRDGRDSIVPGPSGYTPIKGRDYYTLEERDEIIRESLSLIPIPKDGSPDTPEQIANKINTLEEKIEQKTIKGLALLIRNLQNSIREKKGGGGGGMGNVQHQHDSISSVTTTISLPSKIAGNGYALWAYYNGQFIARGTDYTVGADRKTLTLLFTPQDSTVFDTIWIRG